MQAHYTRLFTDERGDSRFEDVAIDLGGEFAVRDIEAIRHAPFLPGAGTFWLGGSASWKGDTLHPAPRRFIIVTVRGAYQVTTSTGEARRFSVGSVLLVEDTTGRGHSTRVVGTEDVIDFCVTLADEG